MVEAGLRYLTDPQVASCDTGRMSVQQFKEQHPGLYRWVYNQGASHERQKQASKDLARRFPAIYGKQAGKR